MMLTIEVSAEVAKDNSSNRPLRNGSVIDMVAILVNLPELLGYSRYRSLLYSHAGDKLVVEGKTISQIYF